MKRQHGGVGARLALFEPQPAPQILHAMGVGPATSLAGAVWRGVAARARAPPWELRVIFRRRSRA
jgi:hypothetical protein